ncbi:MAG TPA: DUF4384 domain-containing protein [bacterium]
MKRNRFLLVGSILFFVNLFSQTDSTLVTVTADGYSYVSEDEILQTAKDRAMKDAERNAIEAGTGVYLESFSRVNQSVLIDDDIRTWCAGYLSSKKVLTDVLEADPPRWHTKIEAAVKCGDMNQYLASQNTEQKAGTMDVAVDFAVLAERRLADGNWGDLNVGEGGELKSFDKFQVLLRPHTDCYAYLLFYDSAGKASLLFPSKEAGESTSLKKGSVVRVPGDGLYFELDDNPGVETLYLLASSSPLADVEWLLEKMEKAGMDSSANAALSRSVATRGIGRVVPGAKASFTLTGGKKVEKVTDLVTGKGALTRKLSFKHTR